MFRSEVLLSPAGCDRVSSQKIELLFVNETNTTLTQATENEYPK
jgi:hypothetical protein